MRIIRVSNQNFNGSVNRGFLEECPAKVYEEIRAVLQARMKNSQYDLFITQERKWPYPNFNKQVKISLWNPRLKHHIAVDYVEVFEHKTDKWLEKFNELIGRNKID